MSLFESMSVFASMSVRRIHKLTPYQKALYAAKEVFTSKTRDLSNSKGADTLHVHNEEAVCFQESVLREFSGLEDSLFIKPGKLHITVGVMCLMDNEERLAASKLLAEANDKYIVPMLREYLPFKIRLKGLSYMNDDPRAIHVLYGCVEEDGAPTGLLQRAVDAVHAHFYKAGFMEREFSRDNIKLHVTLLNSRYRAKQKETDDENTNTERSRTKRESFDGSEILSKFADYDFGVTEFNNIHLSQRSTVGPDGFYQPTCVVSCINTNQ